MLRKCWSVRCAQADVTTLRRATEVLPASNAVMSGMLPTATLRCTCYAVFILPNITAFLSRESVVQVSGHGGYTLASKHKAAAWCSWQLWHTPATATRFAFT